MSVLLPCPFCGGEAYLTNERPKSRKIWAVYCGKCESGTDNLLREDDAICMWNKRQLAINAESEQLMEKFDDCRACLARLADKLKIELPNEAPDEGVSEWHDHLIYELDKWKP